MPFDDPYTYIADCDHNTICKPRDLSAVQYQTLTALLRTL
jgi:hypothetical protein